MADGKLRGLAGEFLLLKWDYHVGGGGGGGSPRPSLFLLPFISLTPSKIADTDIGTFPQSKMFTTCTLTRSTDVG